MASPPTEHTPLRGRSFFCGDAALRVRLLTVIFSVAEGYDLGVITNALAPIKAEFGLTPLMTGVFASSLWWAAMISSLLTGSLIDCIGRKPGIAFAAAVIAAGNLCWACAPNVIVLLSGRIIMGFGIGIGISTVSVYMAEVAPASKRGFYVSMEGLFIDIGIVCGSIAGALLVGVRHDWRIMVGIGMVLPLITCIFALTPIIPESPRFLQANGRVHEAREVLLDLLRDDKTEVDKAFLQWAEDSRTSKEGKGWCSIMRAFVGSHSRVALAGIGTGFFFQFSGITCWITYSALVLIKNGMSEKTAALAMSCVGVLKICTAIPIVFYLMDRWGRKLLLISSAVVLSCGCGFVAYANFNDLGAIWIAVGLAIYACGFSIGLGSVTFAYISEVFDNSTRAQGVACAFAVARLTGASWVLSYPLLTASLGTSAVFCILAGCNACAVVFFWFCCPETLGVALEDVIRIFQDEKAEKQYSKI